MPDVVVFLPDGDFQRLPDFPFHPKYKDAYLYVVTRQCWYKGLSFHSPDWIPVNLGEVPPTYVTALRTIMLLT